MKTFEEIDVVTLAHGVVEHDLSAGSIGTVVHVYGDGAAYEVEFVDEAGETTVVLTLETSQLNALRVTPEAAE